MKNAKITVYNKKTNEDSIEVIYMGKIKEKNGKVTINYDESNLTGMEGVFTELILGENYLEIIRTGNVESIFHFREGLKNEVLYTLDFGSLNLTIETHKLYIVKEESEIKIIIIYDIILPGNDLDRNQMKILVENI